LPSITGCTKGLVARKYKKTARTSSGQSLI
jgi:hypothetical protein